MLGGWDGVMHHATGFCVLGCCFLLVGFKFCWGFRGCGLGTFGLGGNSFYE
jgi:hypothetical protein